MAEKELSREATIAKLLKSAQDYAKVLLNQTISCPSNTVFTPASIVRAFATAAEGRAACLQLILMQEKEIQLLKARLDELENPKTVVLDKGGSRRPS